MNTQGNRPDDADDLDDLTVPEGTSPGTGGAARADDRLEEENDDDLDFNDDDIAPEGKGPDGDKKKEEGDEDPLGGLNEEEEEEGEEGEGDAKPGKPGDDAKPTVFARLAEQVLMEVTGTATEEVPRDLDVKKLGKFLQEKLAPKLHPAAAALQQTLDAGGSMEDFMKSFSVFDELLARSDEDLVMEDIKHRYGKSDQNKFGLDDLALKGQVDRLKANGELALRAIELRRTIEANKEKHFQSLKGGEPAKPVDVSSPEFKQKYDKDFNAFAEQAFSKKELFGITHKNGDKFVSGIRQLAYSALFPKKETGRSEFQEALADPKELLRIAAIYKMAKTGRLKMDLTKSGRNVARQLSEVLDREPKAGKGRGKRQGDGFDANDMADLIRPSLAG